MRWYCRHEADIRFGKNSSPLSSQLQRGEYLPAAIQYTPTKIYPNALSVNQQADELELTLVAPDRKRGQYFGQMVGMDHRAALIKFCKDGAVKLPFKDLTAGQGRPEIGDSVKMKFSNEVLVVNVLERQRWR